MPVVATLADPGATVVVVVTAVTDHVVSVKLWRRTPADANWVPAGEGGTGAGTDARLIVEPLPRNSQIFYWLGISNPTAHERPYEVTVGFEQAGSLLALTQDGQPRPDLHAHYDGRTDASGNAAREDWVNLL